MANSLVTQPLFLDTDQTVAYKSEPTVTALNAQPLGVEACNILINCPSGTSTAGNIVVTDGATTPATLLSVHITATTAFPIVFNYETPLQWRNFKVTGLTATGTTLQIWTR